MPAWVPRLLAASAFATVVAGVAGCSGGSATVGWGDDAGAGQATGSSGGSGSGSAPASSGSTSSSGAGSGSSGDVSGSSSGSGSGAGGSSSGSSSGSSNSSGGGGRDAGVADATARADSSAASDGPTQVTSGDSGDPLAAARAQCVQIINQDRASLTPPSPPLQEATPQEACVDGQAQADFTANTAHSAFGKCKESAQDECPGWPGPPSSIMTKCLAQMWAEGPPAAGMDNHWLNMSNAKYTKVACGFYQTPTGSWWATQDFW